ncbi:MAG TPA: formate--tetrahydrofolate ligase [Bryobacteraceae bacterium]|nr:formate--tetrahydrofolate ligase [Bryobacteraceae bacterium]
MPSLKSTLSQIPSDIDIAQSTVPLPIDQIAADAGILAEELGPYGRTKAKTHLSILERLKTAYGGAGEETGRVVGLA